VVLDARLRLRAAWEPKQQSDQQEPEPAYSAAHRFLLEGFPGDIPCLFSQSKDRPIIAGRSEGSQKNQERPLCLSSYGPPSGASPTIINNSELAKTAGTAQTITANVYNYGPDFDMNSSPG
jgi:hypothetical protein